MTDDVPVCARCQQITRTLVRVWRDDGTLYVDLCEPCWQAALDTVLRKDDHVRG